MVVKNTIHARTFGVVHVSVCLGGAGNIKGLIIYEPTVNPISLFILLAKAATLAEYSISAYDVKGAFLNSPVPDDIYVYVRVDPDLSKLFVTRYLSLQSSVNNNGTLTFRLRRYLYRLQESPLAWNKLLHQKLERLNFTRSNADPCTYRKDHADATIYLTVHVDDMLLLCPNERVRKLFEETMEEQFEITKRLDDLSYLGMTIQKTLEGIRIHQLGYIESLILKFVADPNSNVTSPTGSGFLDPSLEDDEVNKTKYLGLIMSLMFLARFTRADILMPVTYLATKSSDPKQKDYNI
jgi:Reverse transcriptase (RNA-dependent DNA polymerase)